MRPQSEPGALPGPDAQARGRVAERVAETRLVADGLVILERNYRITGAEIDLICRDGDEIVFVEVRARGPGGPEPSATVDGRKLRFLLRGARHWIARYPGPEPAWRLELLAVTLDGAGQPLDTRRIEDPFIHLPEFHHADP